MNCPAWCSILGEHATAHVSEVHMHGKTGEITIAMATDETRREPRIYINGVDTPWHCSEKLARLLTLLGQDEAAATVRRLAELGAPPPVERAAVTALAGAHRYVPLYGPVD